MAVPVPILTCDNDCGNRFGLTSAAFCILRGQEDPGHFCRACREVFGVAEEDDPAAAGGR